MSANQTIILLGMQRSTDRKALNEKNYGNRLTVDRDKP